MASGWAYPFRPKPWDEIESLYAGVVLRRPEFSHMLAIASSVRASNAAEELGAFTISHTHDLMVRPLPPVDPPYDVVAVRSPDSLTLVRTGTVVVEDLSTTGHDDRIERPLAEAVPLF